MFTYRKEIGSTDRKEIPILPHEMIALKAHQMFSEVCLCSAAMQNIVRAPINNKQQLYRYLSIEMKEVMTYREITSLPPRAVYLDVGANVGIYCGLAYLFNPKKIIAFEPLPSNVHSLIQLKELNNMSCMSIYGSPLFSESNRLVPLEVPSRFSAAATGAQLRPSQARNNSAINLKTLSLDEVITFEDLSEVDLIKLDVDGLELPILKGSRAALKDKVFKKIICEAQPDEFQPIKDFLGSYGYNMIDQDPTYKSRQIMMKKNLSIFDVPRNLLFERK